jgi:hypothetical protein
MKLVVMLWISCLLGCSSLKNNEPCKLVDRIDDGDAVILLYSCGQGKDLVCRVHGNKAKGCKKFLSVL